MRYICEKANPQNIIAYGWTMASGGLGTFDASKYQEMAADLPANATIVQPAVATPDTTTSTSTTSASATVSTPDLSKMSQIQLLTFVTQLQTQIAAVQAQLTKATKLTL